ncbi:MAG TPA: peptidoglycan DD-metalloendopeptidase family protein [Chitinophaga sp.]
MLYLKKLIPFILVIWLLPAVSIAQNNNQLSREELERRKKELQKEIDEANEALKETKRSTKESLGQLRALQNKIFLRTRLINNINEEINFINGDINTAYRDVKTLQKDLDTLKAQYAQLVVYAYKNRSAYDLMNFIFSAQNFNDAVKRYQYLKQYRDYRRRQATNIVETQDLLAQKISSLQDQKEKRATTLKSEQDERKTLELDRKEKDEVLTKLKGREKELLADINKRKKDAQNVQAAIRAVIRREIEEERKRAEAEELARRKAAEEKRRREEAARKAAALAAAREAAAKDAAAKAAAANNNNNNVAANPPPAVKETPKPPEPEPERPAPTPTRSANVLEATPEALALSENFEINKGKLPWPVSNGNIIGHFGKQHHAVVERINVENDGIIIATSKGAAVKSIFEGEVRRVMVIPGSGYVVMIRHGQYFTNYVRLQTVTVKTGSQVRTGQMIGTAGTNDIENQGEVELQIYKGTAKQNPEVWIMRR